jgi:hypothetical protein
MDEATAKTKWCPFKRVALSAGMSANWSGNMAPGSVGYGNIHDETRCIGSECMVWRYRTSKDTFPSLARPGYCSLGDSEGWQE